MNLSDISDDELFMLCLEENEEAKNILYDRYKFIIDININKYKGLVQKYGVDIKELESEALLGFSDALTSYRQNHEASIPTFINLCVERRVKKHLIKANRIKNLIVKDAYSLDYVYEQFGSPLLDLISDKNKNDPLENMEKSESYHELVMKIENSLSKLELKVFKLMLDGFNYKQIALMLKISPKQVDNAMQRIKGKIKDILEKRKVLDYTK